MSTTLEVFPCIAKYFKYLESVEQINWANEMCTKIDFEVVVIKIVFQSVIFFVIGLYRSPFGNIEIFLKYLGLLSRLLLKQKDVNVVLLGDLSINTFLNSSCSQSFNDCVPYFGAKVLLGNVAA